MLYYVFVRSDLGDQDRAVRVGADARRWVGTKRTFPSKKSDIHAHAAKQHQAVFAVLRLPLDRSNISKDLQEGRVSCHDVKSSEDMPVKSVVFLLAYAT